MTAPKKFEIRETEIPPIGPNQLLLQIEAQGICMSDVPKYLGLTGPINPEKPWEHVPTFPVMLGHEPAGTIIEVGHEIEGFGDGDRITGTGVRCYGEYGIVDFSPRSRPRPCLIKIPNEVPTEHALGEPLLDTVAVARACEAKFGDYVFAIGCGFMGLLVIAGIAQRGLKELIACDLDEDRLKLAKEFGATTTLNPRDVDVVKEVYAITNGRGVDVALEGTGHSAGLEYCNKVSKSGQALLVVHGWHQVPEKVDLFDWIKGQRIYSALMPAFISEKEQTENLERAMWAIGKRIYKMNKLITHKFRLEEISEGFEMANARGKGYIKGVVTPFA